jgi:hypothetical protein
MLMTITIMRLMGYDGIEFRRCTNAGYEFAVRRRRA